MRFFFIILSTQVDSKFFFENPCDFTEIYNTDLQSIYMNYS